MKVEINSVQLKIDTVDYVFDDATYNGMNVIIESNSKYVNASSFCKQYNKRLGRLFETQNWKEYICEFELEYKDELEGKSTMANLPPWSFKLNKGIPDTLKRIRGLYVHPKLINYIAMWCSPKYAITVDKLMDSINTSIHKQLEEQQLPDTTENSQKLFLSTCETIISIIDDANKRGQQAFEQQYAYGVRDVNESDNKTIAINNAVHDLLKYRESMKYISHPLYESVEKYRLSELKKYQNKPKTAYVKHMLQLLE